MLPGDHHLITVVAAWLPNILAIFEPFEEFVPNPVPRICKGATTKQEWVGAKLAEGGWVLN